MGLLQVGLGAASTVLADQWREYFYCTSLDADVLVTKGEKRQAKKSYNTKGSDNLITNGSIIAVNEGQCMIIVQNGAIVEVCAEAGEFVWDKSTEPTIFYGGLGQGIVNSFNTWKKRFTLGGDTGTDQRIYYFNTKDIIGNKYGTVNPVPFRVVDQNIGLDIEIQLRCHGEYSYRLKDPITFYKKICGNVESNYTRDKIDSQLRTELLNHLQPAFAKIADSGIRYYQITGHTTELTNALREELDPEWGTNYGIELGTMGVSSVKAPEEDEKMIKELQRNAVFRNGAMAGAQMVGATSAAMQSAAANTSAGPMMAFAGMNMAQMAGGVNTASLYQMGQQQGYPQQGYPQQGYPQQGYPQQGYPQQGAPMGGAAVAGAAAGQQAVAPSRADAANVWKCECGTENSGKFCVNCGKPAPAPAPAADGFWTCSCGAKNQGKFCTECGAKKPAGVPQYKCDKCGWTPEDPTKPPKFCPQCGDPFGDEDIVK